MCGLVAQFGQSGGLLIRRSGVQIPSGPSSFSDCNAESEGGLNALQSKIAADLPKLSKHQIEELKSQIYRHYVKRFKRNRIPKYGALNKGFMERELQAFLNAVDDRRLRLLFSYQA